ncbi:MAG: leucine-rich repeat domain-containing protein [Kiritimatiellae bacterium]|nr:leucine-rich repeat domain-containing protein [Kiritimatiellia bacterium]
MKSIFAALLAVALALPFRAQAGSTTRYAMSVGDTRMLYTNAGGKTVTSAVWTSSDVSSVRITSQGYSSCRIEVVAYKSSTPVLIHCQYYYVVLRDGRWGYTLSDYTDYEIAVSQPSGGSSPSVSGVKYSVSGGTLTKVSPNGATSASVPAGVTRIGEGAFRDCATLRKITIHGGVTEIGDCAFEGCRNLTDVAIPASVRTIGYGAFKGCTSLASFEVASNNATYEVKNGLLCRKDGTLVVECPAGFSGTAVVPEGVKAIERCAFYGCGKLTEVLLPGGLEEIRADAFRLCSSLATPVFPGSLSILGSGSFMGCDGLVYIKIPGGVAEIGGSAFYSCDSLESVYVVDGVKSIGMQAFRYCGKLSSIRLPDSIESVGTDVFDGCADSLFDKTAIPGLTLVDGWAIEDDNACPAKLDLSSARGVADRALYGNETLEELVVPAGFAGIGSSAFRKCSRLSAVTFGGGLGRLGQNAFADSPLKTAKVARGETDRIKALLGSSGCDTSQLAFIEPELPSYRINFCRNEASDSKKALYAFDHGVSTSLPTIAELGWARRGFVFKGWATSAANAAAGKVWKKDGAAVKAATDAGKTLDVYAVWALKEGFYAIRFIRNDGSGTWRTVGFPFGTKTRMPSVGNGLGWARRGYDFMGWETTPKNAGDNGRASAWKGDWAFVAEPVQAGETLTVYARWRLKDGYYQIRFNKNDGSGRWRSLGYRYGTQTSLPTLKALGWTRSGAVFAGWGSSRANAASGKVWKSDGARVERAASPGATLSVYAIWE